MTQVILNRLTNYKGHLLKAGDAFSVDYKTALRWTKAGLAHYPNILESGDKLKLEPVKICKPTSIIILTITNLNILKRCIESVRKYTNNFELVIIGNNPDREVKKYILDLKDVDAKIVINKDNKGFGYGCNQGLKIASHEFICFLNDDTVVSPNWLYKLQKTFEVKKDCGIASPATCYSNGIQCDWNIAPHRFDWTEDDINSYALSLKENYVTTTIYGFCMLTTKSILSKVGGFDYKRYGLASAEEVDLEWRLEQVGYKNYWAKGAYVHHLQHSTFKTLGMDVGQICKANKKVFEARKADKDIDLFVENDVKKPEFKIVRKFSHRKTKVIMVTLDRQEETVKTLDSLFSQNKDIDVIVIDNGSKDLSYLKNYKIKLIENFKNKGTIKAINQGLDLSGSKYIVIIHNDITVKRDNWINDCIKFFEKHPDAGIIGTSGWTEINSDGFCDTKNIVSGIKGYNYKFKSDFTEVAVTDGQCNVIRNIGVRLDEQYGLMHFYDKDLSLEYRKRGYRAYVIKAAVEHFAEDRKKSNIVHPKYLEQVKSDGGLYKENEGKFSAKWKNYLPIRKELIPILMTTYNRLPYTKRSLAALLDSTGHIPYEIFIFDNCSTDGTREYLESIKDERIAVHFNKKNTGIIHPKNVFLEKYKDFEYCAFVDNDNIMPKGWLKALKEVMDRYPLIAVQLEHYLGLGWDIKENKDWFKHLYKLDFKGHHVYLNNYEGGCGALVRRSYIKGQIPEMKGTLSGWVTYLVKRFEDDRLVSGFYDGLFMELCDMKGTNWKVNEFDDYAKELNTLGRSEFGTRPFTKADEIYHKKLYARIENIVKGW